MSTKFSNGSLGSSLDECTEGSATVLSDDCAVSDSGADDESLGALSAMGKRKVSDLMEELGVSGDGEETATEEVVTDMEIRNPRNVEFVQASPVPENRQIVAVLKDGPNEFYGVSRAVRAALPDEPTIRPMEVVLAVTSTGVPFLWVLPLIIPGVRSNPWHESIRRAAEVARGRWVRVMSDMKKGKYRVLAAKGGLDEPEWPDLTFAEIFELAFRGRFIDSVDHPVIRRLLGYE